MSFEENMTAFYMAFAEQKLDQLCQSLGNMRLVVQNDSAQLRDRAAAATTPEDDAKFTEDVAVREEMLHACEIKAQSLQEPVLAKLKDLCSPSTSPTDIDSVLQQFYVCAELGGAPAAAPTFTAYMSRTFKTQSRAVLDRVAAFKKTAPVNEHGYIERNFYVEAMSEIMTGATDVMNAVADVTPDALTLRKILTPIHDICTELTLQIVQLYAIDARMAAWERRALDQARRDPRNGEAEVESDESLQMVDLFLDELSFIIRIIMGYGAFVKTICDGLDGVNNSSFGVKIQELNGVYLILERFYIFQSTHKATEIAEVQELESDVFVSSIVEDVSFVLNKSFFRACQCMNYHTALSVVIALVDALESTYLPSIVNLPNRAFVMPQSSSSITTAPHTTSATEDEDEEGNDPGVSFSDMLLAAVDDDLTKSVQEEAKLIMAINSAFMSGEFVESLEVKIDDFCSTTFPQDAPITECLPKPISELKESFRAIVANEVHEVLSSGISKRMEPLVNRLVLERIEYVLTPTQYDAYGLHGSPLNKLVDLDVMKNKVLRRYQTALCASAFEDLVACFVQELTTWLEAALVRFRKQFNELGALQLEREVTDMLDRVTQLVTTTSLRASFTRLFQLVLIVNLLQPSEIVDYADSITRDLTMSEIETFLRMRIEFKADDVRRAMSELRRATATQ